MRRATRHIVRRRSNLLRRRTICKTARLARDDRLLLKVAATSQYVVRLLERRLEETGIAPSELALVTHVRHHQPVTPTEVSTASGIPPTTLRDAIQRLVRRGLVRRMPHPTDRRSYRLELTSRGELMARAADPALAEAYAALERRLPKPLADYERALDELNGALELALVEPTPAAADAVRR